MNTTRKIQAGLLALALIIAAVAGFFYIRAAQTDAKAKALQEEGAAIHGEAEIQKSKGQVIF